MKTESNQFKNTQEYTLDTSPVLLNESRCTQKSAIGKLSYTAWSPQGSHGSDVEKALDLSAKTSLCRATDVVYRFKTEFNQNDDWPSYGCPNAVENVSVNLNRGRKRDLSSDQKLINGYPCDYSLLNTKCCKEYFNKGLLNLFNQYQQFSPNENEQQIWVNLMSMHEQFSSLQSGKVQSYHFPQTETVAEPLKSTDDNRTTLTTYRNSWMSSNPSLSDNIIDQSSKFFDTSLFNYDFLMGGRPMSPPLNFSAFAIDQNMVCPICQKCFRFEKNLLRHLQKTHATGTGESVLKCKLCNYTTRHYSNMYVHIRTHTGDKPYACSACGMSFTQGSSLKLHIKSRHQDNGNYFSLTRKPGKNNLTKLWTRVLKKDLPKYNSNLSYPLHYPFYTGRALSWNRSNNLGTSEPYTLGLHLKFDTCTEVGSPSNALDSSYSNLNSFVRPLDFRTPNNKHFHTNPDNASITSRGRERENHPYLLSRPRLEIQGRNWQMPYLFPSVTNLSNLVHGVNSSSKARKKLDSKFKNSTITKSQTAKLQSISAKRFQLEEIKRSNVIDQGVIKSSCTYHQLDHDIPVNLYEVYNNRTKMEERNDSRQTEYGKTSPEVDGRYKGQSHLPFSIAAIQTKVEDSNSERNGS